MQKLTISTDQSKIYSKVTALYSSGFSPDSPLLSYQGMMIYALGNNIVFDHGNRQATIAKHDNLVTALVISPKRKWLISGQLGSPGNKNYESPIAVSSIEQEKFIQFLAGLRDGVSKLLVSDDENLLAGCSKKGQLIIWNLNNSQQVWVKQFEFPLAIIKLKPDAILFTHGKTLQEANLQPLMQANKNPPINNYSVPSTGLPRIYLSICQISNDKLLLGTEGGEICLFEKGVFKWMENVGKGKVTSLHLCDNRSCILVVVQNQIVKLAIKDKNLQQVGKVLVMGAQLLIPYKNDSTFLLQCKGVIYQIDSGNLQTKIITYSHSGRVNGIDIRGSLIASIDQNGITIMRNWKNNTAQMVGYFAPSKQTQGSCVNIRQDNVVLSGYMDGYIRCTNVKGDLLWELSAHKNGVTTIFTNQLYMLSGGHDSVIRIWSTNNNKLINQISAHQKSVTKAIGDSKEPNFIHSCAIDKTLHTYDMKLDKKINFRTLPNGSFQGMVQTEQGNLITIGNGMPVCIWDIKSVQPLEMMETTAKVTSIAVCRQIIALGSESGQIFLVDLKKRSLMGWWQAHSRQVTTMKWLNDKILVSGCDDDCVTAWQV